MAGDEDVTIGEVYRLVQKVDGRFDNFSANYVPVVLFQAHVKNADERIQLLGSEIGREREARRADRVELQAEISTLETRIEQDKRVKAQQWFAIGLASFVAILSVIGTIVSFSVNNVGGV